MLLRLKLDSNPQSQNKLLCSYYARFIAKKEVVFFMSVEFMFSFFGCWKCALICYLNKMLRTGVPICNKNSSMKIIHKKSIHIR